MEPLAFVLIYVVPTSLVLIAHTLMRKLGQRSPVFASAFVAVAWVLGFYGLEETWPWRTLPITRAIHWLPLGILASAFLCWMLDDESIKKRWTVVTLLSVWTMVAWLMLRPFLLKVNADWSTGQHVALALVVMLGCWMHHAGLVGLSRRLPGPATLIAIGILISGAMLYSFQGASSLKVAQLLSIGGVLAGVLALLAFWRCRLPMGASYGCQWSMLITLPLLYGIYAADGPNLWPLIPLLLATVSGLPFAWRQESKPFTSFGTTVVLGIVVILVGIAVAMTFLLGTEDADDEADLYDAYALVANEDGVREDAGIGRRWVPAAKSSL